ncbi:CHAT domain-containing protein [Nocardioides carbamazepini]|uniref:CHAT domain-containing protein n=1 Tax=Nocardioides carbamazepini TaxID=2854259 RepID=UPI00214A5385|nr:CHAT domain-containing protein [Nocardioides carbamazepini]MCR1785504.1 CHAT domain-containing protein [Nocardioides carbamazepini]
MTGPTVLVLRYADVGVATYASLRVVGAPERSVTWTLEEPLLLAALDELADALPEPRGGETTAEAVARARNHGGFRDPDAELTLAYRLAVLLIPMEAWKLVLDCVAEPRPSLFVAPSARLGRVPWGQLAVPTSAPDFLSMLRSSAEAITTAGTGAARIEWPDARRHTFRERFRLMELADVAMAVPANIAAHHRSTGPVDEERPLLVLDPRVPGQRADGALGSVLGRPAPDTRLSRHYAAAVAQAATLPVVADPVELFRRTDTDRRWLADQLAQRPSRMVFVGHVSAAPDGGGAEGTALHLACRADLEGAADPVGEHRPLQVRDLLELGAPIPPRVALLACASGGDYRFDEAAGLVAAMVLGGAEVVTATLWSLPTAAGFRQAAPDPSALPAAGSEDLMSELVEAVDTAHRAADPGRAVNTWQRAQMRRWREGDLRVSPIYWAAVVTYRFSEGGTR